jgi:hypothetical protein
VAGAAGFGGAGRASAGRRGQTVATPADPEARDKLLDILALTGGADDLAAVRGPDQSLKAIFAAFTDKFVDRHSVIILAEFWKSVYP